MATNYFQTYFFKAHGTRSHTRMGLLSPIMQALHMATVEIDIGLLLVIVQYGPPRYYQSIETYRTHRPRCVQLFNHLFQILFRLKSRNKNILISRGRFKFFKTFLEEHRKNWDQKVIDMKYILLV